MEIKRLRQFRVIVEAQSLTKASKLLHLTPGALSKSMKLLEEEVGAELFVRSGRHLKLTPSGFTLYSGSDVLLSSYRSLLQKLKNTSDGENPILKVASFEIFTTYSLSHFIEQGLQTYKLQVLELGPEKIEDVVCNHRADIGITYIPRAKPDLEYHDVVDIQFDVFARRDVFGGDDFTNIPFAVPIDPLAASHFDYGIDCWPYEQIPRFAQYKLTSLESALSLARRGLCAVFIPKFIAGLHNIETKEQFELVSLKTTLKVPDTFRRIMVLARPESRAKALVCVDILKLVVEHGLLVIGGNR